MTSAVLGREADMKAQVLRGAGEQLHTRLARPGDSSLFEFRQSGCLQLDTRKDASHRWSRVARRTHARTLSLAGVARAGVDRNVRRARRYAKLGDSRRSDAA